jgi:hypothetical protein
LTAQENLSGLFFKARLSPFQPLAFNFSKPSFFISQKFNEQSNFSGFPLEFILAKQRRE